MKLPGISFVRILYCISVFFIAFTIVACHPRKNHKAVTPLGQFQEMVAEMDMLYSPTRYIYKKDIHDEVDSLYHTLPKPTTEDLCNKYLLQSHYSNDDGPLKERYADSALYLIRSKKLENSLTVLYSKAYLYKGEALVRQKNFNDAYRCYYMGIKTIQATDDTLEFNQIYNDLGLICYQKGNYLAAANYFEKCLNPEYKYKKGPGGFINFQHQQTNLDNIGLCYDKSGMTDSAIVYYNKTLSYITKDENEFLDRKGAKAFIEIARGVIYGNLGTAYFHKGYNKKAEILYDTSIGINTKKGYDIVDARLTELKLAELYLKTSRIEEADSLLDTVKASFKTDKYVLQDVKMRWYKLESDYYRLIQHPKEAYVYLNTFNIQKDSVDAVNKKLAGIDFNKVFDDIKQEDSYADLKKQDEINNVNVLVAIIFLSMIIGIAIFIARNNWRLKKLNEKIILQNNEMQQTLGALEQSQRENTRMMGMVAHDLRDPLGAIMNMTTYLLEEEQSKEEQKEYLTLIKTSSSALLGMITDLLSASITPEGMKKEEVDMRGLLHYCVDLLKFKANEKRQLIHLKADDITLEIDREKIWRVVSNLIANAIKFSPENTTIEIEMYRKLDIVQIAIKDQGIGIPDNIKNNIFEVLASVKREGTSGERSFGLGLSISKQIVEALGGKIWFESREGQGTAFYIELPAMK